MLSTGDAEFPHNVNFASYHEHLNHLQHSCLGDYAVYSVLEC